MSGVLLASLLQVIGKARVPIIKFVEKRSGVAFDIRFHFLPLNFLSSKTFWTIRFSFSFS